MPLPARASRRTWRPGQVAVLDRVEREVELGDHPAGLERRQHLAQPRLRPVVEGQDHRPPRQARAVVPVRGEVARQDRRVAVRLEPVELRLERRRQRVVGEERALALRPPRAEVGRDGLHAVVVDDRHAAPRDVQRRGGRRRQGRVGRRVEGGERGQGRRRGRRASEPGSDSGWAAAWPAARRWPPGRDPRATPAPGPRTRHRPARSR